MFTVYITQPGWENYNGPLAGAMFEASKSVEPVTRLVADRISASLQTRLENADGEDLGQGGETARIQGGVTVRATEVPPLTRMTEAERQDEQKQTVENSGKLPADKLYSEPELVSIGEQQGIEGLRKIGNAWGVKDRSIAKLIWQILKAQADFAERKQRRVDDERAAAAAAGDAALAAQLAAEEELMKKARLLPAQTPNAVDEHGNSVFVRPNAVDEVGKLVFVNTATAIAALGLVTADETKTDEAPAKDEDAA